MHCSLFSSSALVHLIPIFHRSIFGSFGTKLILLFSQFCYFCTQGGIRNHTVAIRLLEASSLHRPGFAGCPVIIRFGPAVQTPALSSASALGCDRLRQVATCWLLRIDNLHRSNGSSTSFSPPCLVKPPLLLALLPPSPLEQTEQTNKGIGQSTGCRCLDLEGARAGPVRVHSIVGVSSTQAPTQIVSRPAAHLRHRGSDRESVLLFIHQEPEEKGSRIA